MVKNTAVAEAIGDFRELLGWIAERGPSATDGSKYQELRRKLLEDPRVAEALPDFVTSAGHRATSGTTLLEAWYEHCG